jgi:excisionase family DNA binding protein
MALLLDVPMAAELLGGISPTTVRRMIASGELPIVRLGRRVMIEEKALVEWVERVKRHGTTEKMEEAHVG